MAAPTVTSTAPVVAGITTTTATAGGNVTADGGAAITSRGVVWGTSANPTTALATKTVDAGTTGAYASAITGLTAGTEYYFRAYAVNADGTSYGAETTFKARILPLKLETGIIVPFSLSVPFYRQCTISQAYMEANSVFTPITAEGQVGEFYPVAGNGALYRVLGDGLSTPTFASTFKQNVSSGTYDNTAHKLNLISFLFDGVDYWYNITQPA